MKGGDLRHEAAVMSEAMGLGLGVQPPHPGHMHITPHKAHTHILGLGQVLQPGYQVVPLTMMLPCTARVYSSLYIQEWQTEGELAAVFRPAVPFLVVFIFWAVHGCRYRRWEDAFTL